MTAGAMWAFGGLVGVLAWISYFDIRQMIIPDYLSLPLIPVGLLLNWQWELFVSLQDALIGAACGYFVLKLIRDVHTYLRKGLVGLGLGDCKLMAAFGAWFGWMVLPWIIVGASFFSLMAYAVVWWRIRDVSIMTLPLPYGHWLCLSCVLVHLGGVL